MRLLNDVQPHDKERRYGVSILVLVDAPLELDISVFVTLGAIVSILVLVDAPLESKHFSTIARFHCSFQSLF